MATTGNGCGCSCGCCGCVTCTTCSQACNSCTMYTQDPYGLKTPEQIRAEMYAVREQNMLIAEKAYKILKNIDIVNQYKQPYSAESGVGPYGAPTAYTTTPDMDAKLGNKIYSASKSLSFIRRVILAINDILKYKRNSSYTTQDYITTDNPSAQDKVIISKTFWNFLNDQLHLARMYSNYRNAVSCVANTTCTACNGGAGPGCGSGSRCGCSHKGGCTGAPSMCGCGSACTCTNLNVCTCNVCQGVCHPAGVQGNSCSGSDGVL